MPRPPHTPVLTSIFLFLFLLPLEAFSQAVPFRVMTYNTLRVSSNDGDRLDEFETIFEASNPDILVTQEIENLGGANIILQALNATSEAYSMAPFINGQDSDNALFYRTELVTFVSQDTIKTALREVSEYIVDIAGIELRIYGAHLKAGDGAQNQNIRFDEAVILRDRLDQLAAGTEFILLGDLNLTSSSEPAYQRLTQDRIDNDGRVRDLVDSTMIGSWRNNPAFASIHSQSPRTVSFMGGATGGMDDRFDFVLGSYDLNNEDGVEFVEGSYTVFGNDGLHFNTSILDGPNAVVSASVARALHDASDHLPVFVDFISLGTDSLPPPDTLPSVIFSEIFYDTPGIDGDEEWIELYNPMEEEVNLEGWYFTDNNGQGATYVFPAGASMLPNSYYTVANDASAFDALYGYDADLYGSLPGLNNSGDALLLFSPEAVQVDEVAWEGGASKGLPDDWGSLWEPRALRGEAIARSAMDLDTDTYSDWEVVTANGSPQTQTQTLFITGLHPFGVDQKNEASFEETVLNQNYPNPVHTWTQVEYSLSRAGHVSIVLYDMLGREVKHLVDTYQAAGLHSFSMDASDLPGGVYIYRMQTGTFTDLRQLIVAR